MPNFLGLSEDKITGQVAPVGHITDFPRPHFRSAWPTPIGKPLTDRKIALYAKKGKYVTNTATGKTVTKREVKAKKLPDFI